MDFTDLDLNQFALRNPEEKRLEVLQDHLPAIYETEALYESRLSGLFPVPIAPISLKVLMAFSVLAFVLLMSLGGFEGCLSQYGLAPAALLVFSVLAIMWLGVFVLFLSYWHRKLYRAFLRELRRMRELSPFDEAKQPPIKEGLWS